MIFHVESSAGRRFSRNLIPYFAKNKKDVAKIVVCCSRDWRFKGKKYKLSVQGLEKTQEILFFDLNLSPIQKENAKFDQNSVRNFPMSHPHLAYLEKISRHSGKIPPASICRHNKHGITTHFQLGKMCGHKCHVNSKHYYWTISHW